MTRNHANFALFVFQHLMKDQYRKVILLTPKMLSQQHPLNFPGLMLIASLGGKDVGVKGWQGIPPFREVL